MFAGEPGEIGGGAEREGDIVQGSGERWAAKTFGWNPNEAGLLGLALAICAPRAPGGLLLTECTGGSRGAEGVGGVGWGLGWLWPQTVT